MRARTAQAESIEGKRYLSLKEGLVYMSVGKDKFRAFCNEIGATRKVGSRVVYDREIIDAALADQTAEKGE